MKEFKTLKDLNFATVFSSKTHKECGQLFIVIDVEAELVKMYHCTNDSRYNGADSPDKLGYAYSWVYARWLSVSEKQVVSYLISDLEAEGFTLRKIETLYDLIWN